MLLLTRQLSSNQAANVQIRFVAELVATQPLDETEKKASGKLNCASFPDQRVKNDPEKRR